jgi:hypothetical protein
MVAHNVAVRETAEAADVLTASVTVTRPDQLAAALKQRSKPVVIEDAVLVRKFLRLEYWREARLWFIAWLIYRLLASALVHQYHLEADWHLHWKLMQTDGRLVLTPPER